MDKHRYLQLIAEHAAAIGAAAQVDPDADVPSCPGWQLRDLAHHIAQVAVLWTEAVRQQSLERPDLSGLVAPIPDTALDTAVGERIAEMLEVLEGASDDAPAWNWWGDPTARSIPRRAAHEMIIHGWDAANATGAGFAIDAEVGVDGIHEFFVAVLPRTRHGFEGPAGTVALQPTDDPTAWSAPLSPGERPGFTVGLEQPDATLRAPAGQILLTLWRRQAVTDDVVEGNRALIDALVAYPRLG